MSNHLHNNERYLKELADQHKPVPPTTVWDEIEQVLDEDKGKRRILPIFWIFGGLLIVALTFTNTLVKIGSESPIVEQETEVSEYQKQNDPNLGNNKTVNSEAIKEAIQRPSANNTDAIINKYQKQVDPNSSSYRTVDSEVTHEITQTRKPIISESLLLVPKNKVEEKAITEISKSFVIQQDQSHHLKRSTQIGSKKAETNTTTSDAIPVATHEETLSTNKLTLSAKSNLEQKNISQVTTLQRLTSTLKPLEISIQLPVPNEDLTSSQSSGPKSKVSFDNPWFVELGGGIGRNLKNPEILNPELGQFRFNTETRWYSWSTAFQLGYHFDDVWYSSIGIDFNQTKRKFDYWRRDVSSLVIEQNLRQINTEDFFNLGEMRYTFVDVGLSIGRRFNIDKLHLSLEGGAIFNALFNASGKVQVGTNEFSRLENQKENYNSQIGLGTRFSAMLDYPVADQMWISIGPTYREYFNTISSDQNPLEEQNATLQVLAKIRYQF